MLPGEGVVRARWMLSPIGTPVESTRVRDMGLLLVPFPYQVDENAFQITGQHDGGNWGWFEVDQHWLPDINDRKSRTAFVAYIVDLVECARNKQGRVDGVILPELALDYPLFAQLAQSLAQKVGIDFIISGVLRRSRASRELCRRRAAFRIGR